MLARPFVGALSIVLSLAATSSVGAQPLGSFSWQLQPFCNRVTFAVTQVNGAFMLAGYDDQCGAAVHAAASGVASLNPNGSVNLGISIITPDVGTVHVDATLDLATLNGTWRDSFQHVGTLAFNGAAPGNPRPSPTCGFHQAGGYFLPRVAALRPVTFSWRREAFPGHGFGRDREAGLIAQDVEQVLPDLVVTGEDGYKAVNYSRLPLLAIQAIKELKERNDALEARLAALEALVAK